MHSVIVEGIPGTDTLQMLGGCSLLLWDYTVKIVWIAQRVLGPRWTDRVTRRDRESERSAEYAACMVLKWPMLVEYIAVYHPH